MEQLELDKKIQSKLLYKSKQYFITTNNNITKINNEQYSYLAGNIKIYVFDKDELFNFLSWYWYNYRNEFLFDSCNIDYHVHWKYFNQKNQNFIDQYPSVEIFQKNVIEKNNMVELFENLINICGINNFLNDVIIPKYKIFDIKKIENTFYKFATNNMN